jgi:hypothetical protein
MSRLTRVIAPLLSKAGLEIRAVGGADGQGSRAGCHQSALPELGTRGHRPKASWSRTTGGVSATTTEPLISLP